MTSIVVRCVGYGHNKVGCTVHRDGRLELHTDGRLRKGQTVADFEESVREQYRKYVPPGFVPHFEQLRREQGLSVADVARGIRARVPYSDPYDPDGVYVLVSWLRGYAEITREEVLAWGAALGLSEEETIAIMEAQASPVEVS